MRGRGRVVVGVDEAGRGPIIGPMVIAAAAFKPESLELLSRLGVRDSKELTAVRRSRLAPLILEHAEAVVVIVVPPALIDFYNLNRLEEEEIVYAVRRIVEKGFEVEKLYVDAVGPASRLRDTLAKRLGLPRDAVVVEAKADQLYPPVSAASILAKVVRDSEIEKLRRAYGVRGSGYPTDPETLSWIREAYARSPSNPPDFIRRTWSTLKRIAPGWYLEKKPAASGRQRSLLDFLAGTGS
jgi:ribonuclease HII